MFQSFKLYPTYFYRRVNIFSGCSPLGYGPVAVPLPTSGSPNRTVARKFPIGGVYICAGGVDILKFDENSSDL